MRTTQSRWWTIRHFAYEPPLMHRYTIVGVLLAVAGFASAAGFWLWIYHKQPATWNKGTRCACQLRKRDENRLENDRQLKNSRERTNAFQQALQDQTSPSFAMAREQIQKEKEISSKLDETASALQIESLGHFSFGLLALLIPTITLSLMAGRLMIAHAHSAYVWRDEAAKLTNWRRPYWLFVVLPLVVNEGREIKTSVLDIDKSWFGWSSFCVCPVAWLLLGVMALGVFMVVAYPASIMWCLSKSSRCPSKLDVNANDGAWGVGSYVLFLQTWSIVILVFLLFPAVIWLRIVGNGGRLSLAYLATGSVLFFLAFVLEGRLIWNAIRVRLLYYEQLRRMGSTWSEIQAQDPPGDPTTAFLGEKWWSLPATIFGALAVLWALVQWSGASALLDQLITGAGH